MPVQWLYVLQDGRMVVPASGGDGNIAVVPGATLNNPIVGRIAYWTDDECSKVNINTAAGNARGDGTYASWETPRFASFQDVNYFSKALPLGREYQRYAGHPATTNLYDILTGLRYESGYGLGKYPGSLGSESPFFSLLPYYSDDYGSKQGTLVTTGSERDSTLNPSAKSERLYASLSELFYQPDRATNDANTLNRHTLETGKFFLTTSSRAPEATLFGTPRVSMWPLDVQITGGATNKPRVTAYDEVIAFCSSVGRDGSGKKYPYFFQRQLAGSMTNDWEKIPRNQQLFQYLLDLTSKDIPGFGGNFAAKYSVNHEWEQILTQVFDYIRSTNGRDTNLTAANSFATGVEGGRIMPLRIKRDDVVTQGLGRYHTLSEVALLVICTADGNGPDAATNGAANDWRSVSNLAASAKLKNSAGVAVGKDGTANSDFDANRTLTNGPFGSALTPLSPGEKKLQAMLLLEPSSPLMGNRGTNPYGKIRVRGLDSVSFTTAAGTANPFPSANESKNVMVTSVGRIDDGRSIGGTLGPRWMVSLNSLNSSYGADKNFRTNGWEDQANTPARYPYVSNPFTVRANTTGSTMAVSGKIYIDLYLSSKDAVDYKNAPAIDSTDMLVQTFEIELPGSSVPVPDLLQNGLIYPTTAPSKANEWWGFTNRVNWINNSAVQLSGGLPFQSNSALIRADLAPANGGAVSGWSLAGSAAKIPMRNSTDNVGFGSDTTLSLLPFQYDFRLTAAKPEVTTSTPAGAANPDFAPHEYYGQRKLAHSFTAWRSDHMQGFAGGKLAREVTYNPMYEPKVPSNLPQTVSTQGDWDSGWPVNPDGAYANKPDEGNLGSGTAAPYFQSGSVQQADAKYFSPNLIMPSAVMLGSLPTGVKENIPWRTLNFRPQKNRPLDPAGGPKDYLLLDFFHMPIVDPYAISEPLSTAGKINMNYAMVPFSYITRSTGVRAVLSSEMVARVPASRGADYKYTTIQAASAASGPTSPARLPINLSEVNGALRQFQERFAGGDIFRSPAEICEIYLPPDASRIGGNQYHWTSDAQADAAWYDPAGDFALLGDNVRERPYATLYPRLTTKSNSFKVYYTVQALKNPRGASADPTRWDERKGVIEGEFRGSTSLERFIDPENPNLKDYATDPSLYTPGGTNTKTLDSFYQWRVVSSNAFPL
jgi:uncharacterized protein (TIGR02600 family)